jgi:prophage tail gpP-like protein
MPRRPVDQVSIETARGGFTLFSSVELVQDLLEPASLQISVGDDRSWRVLSSLVAPGREVRLFLNGRLQFTGRFEENDTPATVSGGSVSSLVARTKLSDAVYRSADPKTRVSGSIKDFLLALYEPLGYEPSDFLFDAAADRNLITGIRVGQPAPVDLEPIQEGRAKVQPGEEIFTCAKRHLARHHLMHWDAADGRIVVGRPDDAQAPIYFLRTKRGPESSANNVNEPRRIRDWSELLAEVRVYGNTLGEDDDPQPIRGTAVDLDAFAVAADNGHFNRLLLIPLQGPSTNAKAAAQAQRELASRSKRKSGWDLPIDDWTFWNGRAAIPWALNTTVDVDVDIVGAEAGGRWLITRVSRVLDAERGAYGSISVCAPGIFVL